MSRHYGCEHRADAKSPARIELDFWLIVKRGPRNGGWPSRPGVRVTADEPNLSRDERAVNLKMTLPVALFETPSITAKINVETPAERVEIDVPALTESVKQALGMDVEISVVEPQNGLCALCAEPPDRAMNGAEPKLVVDHNHDTGQVRGLLCFNCNVRLATIEDEQFMLLARLYLRRHDGIEFVNDLGPHPYLERRLEL